MDRIILTLVIVFLFQSVAFAQFFGFGDKNSQFKSKIPVITEKLKNFEMKADPSVEENLNLLLKSLEDSIDQEKLFCAGEAMDENSKYIAPNKKEVCMRELKQKYIESTEVVFELKKKYLKLVLENYQDKLSEIQKESLKSIESKF
jgi:hypothetical protein